MAINNYTFFSLHGNDFPVTANSDGKLYMMLTGMNYNDFRLKHWTPALNTALNRIYTKTSMVVGGRYFELQDHSVTLKPAQTNFIHAVINVSNMDNPVTITVEDQDNTNSTNINDGTGALKVCFEQVVTSGSAVTAVTSRTQNTNVDNLIANDQSVTSELVTMAIGNGVSATFQRKGEIVNIRWSGTLTAINNGTAFTNKAPVQMRPNGTKELIGHYASSDNSFHIDLETDGTFRWWGRSGATGAVRGSAVYFIK